MKKSMIGNVALGKMPVVAAVIESRTDLPHLAGIRNKGVCLVEFRFDLMGLSAEESLSCASGVKEGGLFGIIGTLRETPANKDKRVAFFETVMPAVDAVDIEILSGINRTVIELAKGKTVIVSHHDFEKTPSQTELETMADRCFEQGGHIAKIAVTVRSNRDMDRLEEFTKQYKKPFVSIAMGPLGRDWRVRAFKAGSLFTYAHIGEKPIVPGQLSVDELSRKLAAAFPSFKTYLKTVSG